MAVQKVYIDNACDATQISFSNPVSTSFFGFDAYANSNAPPNLSCNVFSANGGGMNYKDFPTTWYAIPVLSTLGYQTFTAGSVSHIGTGVNGLVFFVRGIQKATCQAINAAAGISSNLPARAYLGALPFTGSASFSAAGISISDETSGHPMGCYSYDGSTEYDFYDMVLIR